MRPVRHPLRPFLDAQGVVILDGGLATLLEARGASLGGRLWSARVLLDDPEAIRRAHRAFLGAGADCIETATYQASVPGLEAVGASPPDLFRLAARLAVQARDSFWQDPANRPGRIRPIVAASLGPYGACLADGSEYTGLYDVGDTELLSFHEERLALVRNTGIDIVAWETVPSGPETDVLTELTRQNPDVPAWLSFSCRDEAALWDGTEVTRAVRAADRAPFQALGVNCTDPAHVTALVARIRTVTDKPLLVYPNHGGRYDPVGKRWTPPRLRADWARRARAWHDAGASGIGGCCHVGPEEISTIRKALLGAGSGPLRAPGS